MNIYKRININPFLFIIIVFAYFGKYLDIFLISYFICFIHEVAHILGAIFFKVKLTKIELLPFGIRAKLQNELIRNPDSETIIASLGPLSNILLIIILEYIHKNFSNINFTYYSYIIKFNIGMALLNLFPILPLDGARILRSQLSKYFGLMRSFSIIKKISAVLSIILFSISIYLFLISSFNFSFILIGVFLLSNLSIEERTMNIVFLKETLNNSKKFLKKDINKIKTIGVYCNFPAIRLLKYFSYNEYHIIIVFNESIEIKKIVSETQVINCLIKDGAKYKL